MLIIIFMLWIAVWFGIGCIVVKKIINVRVRRKNIAFANLPMEVLLAHALLSPIYASEYRSLLHSISKEEATRLVVNHMLLNMGIIGYRKERS